MAFARTIGMLAGASLLSAWWWRRQRASHRQAQLNRHERGTTIYHNTPKPAEGGL